MNAPKNYWVNVSREGSVERSSEYETLYIRADLVDGLVEALSTANDVFRVYQAHHEAKGDMTKAEANKGYAEQMEAALAKLEEE